MKQFIGIFVLILGLGSAICVLWILQHKDRGNSEVVKIYKTTPYVPRSVRPVESSPSVTSVDVSTKDTTEDADAFETGDDAATQSTTDNFSDDEAAFLEMLLMLEEEPETEEEEDTVDTEDEVPELTGGEIERMVLEAYDLHDILAEYDVTVSPYDNQGTCPLCSTPETFEVMLNGNTGNYDYWGCAASYCIDNGVLKSNDLIDFVARMEGRKRGEAARYLAERRGILE